MIIRLPTQNDSLSPLDAVFFFGGMPRGSVLRVLLIIILLSVVGGGKERKKNFFLLFVRLNENCNGEPERIFFSFFRPLASAR
jgi:hypothetical protein